MKNPSQHSPETVARMRANSEAAKKRIAKLNAEHLVRERARKILPSRTKSSHESFGEAIARVAQEARVKL